MIYLLFVVSTLLAVWCGYNKAKLAREGKRVMAAFVSSAFPFLISLAVVSGVFAIVATVIYWADQDSRTIDTLYRVETMVHSMNGRG